MVNAIEMLTQLLDTVNLRLHHSADDLLPSELTARALTGVNTIGFIVWHMARSQDWAVNTAIRDLPEVVTREPWRHSSVAVAGIGTGFDSSEADEVARRVDLPPVSIERRPMNEVNGALADLAAGRVAGRIVLEAEPAA